MPCPSGASKEPITSPFLSMWIIEGGRVQQSAVGAASSALSSMSLKSFGRSSTHTLSSLSTANPVTPPIFHLLGRGLGQSGSNLYFGGDCVCAPIVTDKPNKQRHAMKTNTQLRTFRPQFISPSSYRVV